MPNEIRDGAWTQRLELGEPDPSQRHLTLPNLLEPRLYQLKEPPKRIDKAMDEFNRQRAKLRALAVESLNFPINGNDAELHQRILTGLCLRGVHEREADAMTMVGAGAVLKTIAAAATVQGKRVPITKKEANVKARDYLRDHQKATVRQVASGIGCAEGTVAQLPAWKAVMGERRKGRTPKAPRAVSLTRKLEAGTGKRDAELERLTQEQADDERHGQRLRNRTP